MKRAVVLGFLLALFMSLAAMAMADTFTPFSSGVNYAVNTVGGFFTNSMGYDTGLVQSYNTGSYFHLAANTGVTYSDAGVLAYFNGGLKLGDLLSVSVASMGDPVTVNLWLDTGGDGRFFSYDSSGKYTGLNGDTYGGTPSAAINQSTVFGIWAGNGNGHSYTLAALQAGVVPGITANTSAALWIGLTNSHSADIYSFTVATTEANPVPSSVLLLSSGLLGLAGWRRFRKS